MTTVAIVQARTSSTRLPNKVLATIAGKPMLYWVCHRAKKIVGVDRVVVALGDGDVEQVRAVVRGLGVSVIQGERDDVLARYVQAAEETKADVIVRLTADCPVLDPTISSRVLHKFLSGPYDYCSNVLPPSFPDGTDTEVFSRACLDRLYVHAQTREDREHVTLYLRRQPWKFKTASISDLNDRSRWMWSCNVEEDLIFIRAAYKALGPVFGMSQLIAEMNRYPALAALMRRNSS